MHGAADRGQPQRARRPAADRIPAQQGCAIMVEHFGQPIEEAGVPVAQHEAQQHAHRLRALGGEVGQIAGHQFPRDIGRISIGAEMHAFHHHVMRQHQRLAPDVEHGGVVRQPARARMQGQGAQHPKKGGLAAHRTSLATASSTPFTNFASRSSKKAWATSTYSVMTVAWGTSGRASSS